MLPLPCVLCAQDAREVELASGRDEGCDRALCFDFCFGLGACCSFFLEAHKRVDHDVGVGEHVFDGGWRGVHAVLADRGEDFRGHPATELHCFWLVTADDDFVESRLVDEQGFLFVPYFVDDVSF